MNSFVTSNKWVVNLKLNNGYGGLRCVRHLLYELRKVIRISYLKGIYLTF